MFEAVVVLMCHLFYHIAIQEYNVIVRLRMLPSNAILCRNIDYLLQRFRLDQESNVASMPVFFRPQLHSKLKSNLLYVPSCNSLEDKQFATEAIEERVRVLNDYSTKAITFIKKRRASESTIEVGDNRINRYNMSIDKVIRMPNQSLRNRRVSRDKDSSINSSIENQKVTRRGNTLGLLRRNDTLRIPNRHKSNTRGGNENFEFDYDVDQVKPRERRKKILAGQKAVVKQVSPTDRFTIVNFSNINRTIQTTNPTNSEAKQTEASTIDPHPHPPEPRKPLYPRITPSPQSSPTRRKDQKHGDKSQKHQKNEKFLPRSRNCKQMYLNRVLKSKTQILKRDDRICAWGPPEDIAQDVAEDPPIRNHEEQFM